MVKKTARLAGLALLISASPAFAEDGMHDKGPMIFHALTLETDYGVSQHDPIASWDLDGWVGGDINKLWLKSEGEIVRGKTEQAELWALYSRNIATFWDVQAGFRYDFSPRGTPYLALGVQGLAPYYFETEAHLFISDEGDVSARLREENDFLLTQRLILQPYAEVNLYAQDVPEQDIGAGIADGEIGLQTRYEITRQFAPYIDVKYERKFGETSSIAKHNGEDNDDVVGSLGIRLMF
ncbi:MAG: copper resistance protein B [Alphaproteobacteria bacterium]|nr:copper resistance protein B [Alphaproteobacteria bacterium]